MSQRTPLRPSLGLMILGSCLLGGTGTTLAFDMGNMMNPSRWMNTGGNRGSDHNTAWGGPGDGVTNGYGAPGGGYGAPAGYGMPSGYGAPAGYGMPSSYGAPAGYGMPSGYGAPADYGVPSGYGAPAGYGMPSGYGAPAGYGVPSGYGSPTGYGIPSGTGNQPMMGGAPASDTAPSGYPPLPSNPGGTTSPSVDGTAYPSAQEQRELNALKARVRELEGARQR